MTELVSWDFCETHDVQRVVGRIGAPGDRTVRHARGTVTHTLDVVVGGKQYEFEGEEAEAIALILATEIP